MKVYGLRSAVYTLVHRKKGYFILLLFFLFTNSCKTDFDIIAPYKQITVVYGLLDPAATTQYIKINKAFLGQGNALVMAQQYDSTNYPPGTLDVKLQRLSSGQGQVVQTIQLDTTGAISKDTGLFSNPYQVLYKANFAPVQDGSTYKLVIFNKSDQQTLSSTTDIVGAITNISRPGAGEPINFTGIGGTKYTVLFTAADKGRLYSLIIRFHYTEINTLTHDTTSKYINWDHGSVKSQHLDASEEISFTFNKTDFYGFVRSQLAADPALIRKLPSLPIEFIITYAGDDLSTYIDVNQPSLGIIQQKPEFTNIKNGIGIFSSRSTISLLHTMDPASIDSLQSGDITKDLNFQ